MDAVIKQAVREELRRHLNDPNPPTATRSSNDHNNSTDPGPNLWKTKTHVKPNV